MALAWILVALNIGMVGDVLLKKGGAWSLALGAALFFVTAFPTWKAYQFATFSSLTILWQSCYLVEGLIVGVCVFGDKITWSKAVAVVLALAAIMLTAKE